MSDSNSYGFGGKLIAAIVFALLCGYVWACVEEGRSPLAILKMFSKEEPEAAEHPVAKKESPKTEAPVVRKTEAPKTSAPIVEVKKTVLAPAPAGPKMYSAIDMTILFNETDELLRRGKLFEAQDRVKSTSRLLIPQDTLGKFNDYEARVGLYHSLLLETTKAGTVEMPKMTQFLIKDGGKLIAKVIHEDKDSVTYETLTGIRSKIDRSRCEEIKQLEPVYARVEVKLELKKQADYKGLVIEEDPGNPAKAFALKDKPGRSATSLQIFDLADFCARNGANERLVPLFDEALARDKDLLNTVHEAKAERMVEVLVYFLSIKATYDAKKTLEILKERYAETRAYKEHVSGDSEFLANMNAVFSPRPSGPIARVSEPKPAPAVPAQKGPPPSPAGPPPAEPPPAPKPPEPVVAPIRGGADPAPPGEVTAVSLPDGTNEKISALVAKGDRYFKEAMEHLNNCDPRIKPETAGEENKKALKLFMQAVQEGYSPAQDEYKSGRIPEALLDRVREAQQRAYFCRKFAVGVRK
jgi:hypothetical protein